MRRLFFPGYYSGFSNNRMSLDIAVVLAHVTGRTLVPYRFRMPRRGAVPDEAVLEPMLVPEMFDLPVPYVNESLFKTWVSTPAATHVDWPLLVNAVCCLGPTGPVSPPGGADFEAFRNGRPHVLALTPEQQEATDLHIRTDALAHYSYLFHGDEAQRRAIIDLMRRLQPRAPYRALADRVVAHLGPFNAIHLRRGDFLRNALTQHGITRTVSVTGDEIVGNLAAHMASDEPLLICTDGSPDEDIFVPIRRHFRQARFLDDELFAVARADDSPLRLEPHDEAAVALVTQLVASRARVFAGTLFSTFTGLIHRLRAFDRPEAPYLYTHNDFLSPEVRFVRGEFLPVADGPYTWNRVRYPVSPDAYSWLREWPESAAAAPVP